MLVVLVVVPKDLVKVKARAVEARAVEASLLPATPITHPQAQPRTPPLAVPFLSKSNQKSDWTLSTWIWKIWNTTTPTRSTASLSKGGPTIMEPGAGSAKRSGSFADCSAADALTAMNNPQRRIASVQPSEPCPSNGRAQSIYGSSENGISTRQRPGSKYCDQRKK